MKLITEIGKNNNSKQKLDKANLYLDKIYEPDLRKLLNKCYQCVRCSGVCQLSKVQSFVPSIIIQKILEGFEGKVIPERFTVCSLKSNQVVNANPLCSYSPSGP